MSFFKNIISLNSSRVRLQEENAKFAQSVPNGSLVLDAGAGSAPYKDLFKHANYETADFEKLDKNYTKLTYVCDLKSIPVEDNRFDFIVFNQVMEHLPEPKLVLIELNRVLKPGGKMIYTGPLIFEEHEQPYDYYRYTQYALRLLFAESMFVIERIDWLEGYFGTVGYQLNRMARYLPINPHSLGGGVLGICLVPFMGVIKLFSAALSIGFQHLETRVKYKELGYPKNYIAIVSKQ